MEITVWLFAIGQVMKNLNNLGCSLSFAVGFALGNYLGVLIDQKLALGFQVVRVITGGDPAELVQALKAAGYGVTSIDGRGGTGPVRIVFSVIPRREFENVLTLLRRFDPNVFYSVDCLHTAAAGVFPLLGAGPARRCAPGAVPARGTTRRRQPRHNGLLGVSRG